MYKKEIYSLTLNLIAKTKNRKFLVPKTNVKLTLFFDIQLVSNFFFYLTLV